MRIQKIKNSEKKFECDDCETALPTMYIMIFFGKKENVILCIYCLHRLKQYMTKKEWLNE